ncbi:hypothetical protein [Mariprofundus sp. NF]|jgi:hypothetical protein|nr:hypothetical protein [Mariprofundus sp. NF]
MTTATAHIEDSPKIIFSNATKKRLAITCFAVAAILSVKILIDLSALV